MMPVPLPALDIRASGLFLFQTVKALLEAQGVEIPALAGVVPGSDAALDGAQLTLRFMNITPGQPGAAETHFVNPSDVQQTLNWEIDLMRAVATVENRGGRNSLPSMTDQADDFAKITDDASALWAAMVTIHSNYLIVSSGVPLTYGPMLNMGPQGGIAGVRMPVSWQAT